MKKVVSAVAFAGLMGLACMSSASEISQIREELTGDMGRTADDMAVQKEEMQRDLSAEKDRMKSGMKAGKEKAKAKRKQMKADAKAKAKAKKETIRAKSKALKNAGEGAAHEMDGMAQDFMSTKPN